jgi:hypothetical protein
MMLKNLVEGIEIMRKYYDDPDEHHHTCEHDEFIMFPTDNRISEEDYEVLVALDWYQPEVANDDHEYNFYDQEESWVAPSAA